MSHEAMILRIPTVSDLVDARQRLAGVVVHTPLLRSDELDRLVDAKVFVKAESLQRTGAFKFRGAYNCLSRLSRIDYPGGVVAYSTGNHGQAIATVAQMLGLAATIVMPADAPAIKMDKARKAGATVVTYDRATESREAIAERISTQIGALVVPPGDHPDVIAGQGTAIDEALSDLALLGEKDLSAIIVPCGGGGLAAGSCLAVQAHGSKAAMWAAEPHAFDDTRRSLVLGQRVLNRDLTGSICDALLAPTPAELPFAINRSGLARVLTADDAIVEDAMRHLFQEFRLVVEPGGAMAIAALLAQPGGFGGATLLAMVSGGNVDPDQFARIIAPS